MRSGTVMGALYPLMLARTDDSALNSLCLTGEPVFIQFVSVETLTSDIASPVLAAVLGLVTTENATDLFTAAGFNLLLSPNSLVLKKIELPHEFIYTALGLTGYDI
jgi:hypothetical protein